MEFLEFPKIARLSRECIVTEKIDGTNAQVHIIPESEFAAMALDTTLILATRPIHGVMLAGSRTRYIVPASDNHGWAAWVREHSEELWGLGPGRHFGEWWGSGIQRGYGLQKGEKRFSLFNTTRWCLHDSEPQQIQTGDPRIVKMQERLPACVSLVPELYRGPFDTATIEGVLYRLRSNGSSASPGFPNPEGIVVFHMAANVGFKKTLERDEEPKSFRK